MTFNNRTRCAHCKRRLEEGQRIHLECVEPWQLARQAKKEREEWKKSREAIRVEKAQDKQKRESQRKIPELIALADKEFCAYIRKRDQLAGYPCISSGKPLKWGMSNQVDAGHYRSRGAASHLRYNEDNCHAQSKHDNRFLAGNIVQYRIGLIARIGLERVEALEASNAPHKWTREELIQITQTYRQKLRELQG